MYLFLLMRISVAIARLVALSCSTVNIGRVQGAQNLNCCTKI
jgi:hypothetical protein